jgi:predicted DNA-binding transcriptional regulator YafY
MATDRSETAKLERIFKLIELLSGPPYYKTADLARQLGCNRTTVERYYTLLERFGYQIDKDDRNRYFIFIDSGLDDSFSTEEAGFLNDLLRTAAETSPVSQGILLKLNRQYRLSPMVQSLQRNGDYVKLREIMRAASEGKIVHLLNYVGSAGKVSPLRRIAITGLSDRNRRIHAMDLEAPAGERSRQFILNRIGGVEVTNEAVPTDIRFADNDVFGWPGQDGWLDVTLVLSNRARLLLTEEYPTTLRDIHRQPDGTHTVNLRLRGFEAAGRWVLGLPGEVRVLPGGDGEDFRAYLRERARVEW